MSTLSMDLRSEIAELARTAEREHHEKQAKPAPRRNRRNLVRLVWVGVVLATIETGLLAYQLSTREHPTVEMSQDPHPLLNAQTCAGAKYRTFRALIAFRRERGVWPAMLGELLGDFLSEIPVDPRTGQALVYTSDGHNVSIECSDPRASSR